MFHPGESLAVTRHSAQDVASYTDQSDFLSIVLPLKGYFPSTRIDAFP